MLNMESEIDASFSSELIRVGTFINWPGLIGNSNHVKPSALDLAKTGFRYTGTDDEVRCFTCGLSMRDWERHHDPVVVHATRSPMCPMVLGKRFNNVPVVLPDERERVAILAALRTCSKNLSGKVVSSNQFPSPICDTLTSLFGETMMCTRDEAVPQPKNTDRTLSSSSPVSPCVTARQHSRDQPNYSISEADASRSATASHSASLPPQRSCSADRSEVTETDVARPPLQRARSYAYGQSSLRNSETVANRQGSLPSSDYTEYRGSEEARLSTFQGWPGIRGTTAQEFAQAGFIYIGAPDHVQCVFCSGILSNWVDNNMPIEEHRRHFPNCSFVSECLSTVTIGSPRHPMYQTLGSRERSFLNWSRAITRTPVPEDLAKAGFFYVGHGDSVKCFFCDGGLRNWEPNDDPWREHARWFPKCDYVKQAKGMDYINAVQDSNVNENQTASFDDTEVKSVVKQQGSIASREVDPREVTARMDGQIVKTVLKMDVPKDCVRKAIIKRLSEDGEDFSCAEALLEAVFNLGTEDTSEQLVLTDGTDSLLSDAGSDKESLRLMEENRQLKEQKQCKICMDEEVCVAFLPCGHLVCCSTCAPALSVCPICRARIRGTVRTYMA